MIEASPNRLTPNAAIRTLDVALLDAASAMARAARVAWPVVALAGCVAAAIAASWPLALHLTTSIPMGTEREATVPLFNLWTLWWSSQGFAHYWDAPIFYPTQGTFTFSEPQPLTGLLVAPLWGLHVAPALIYNIVFLGILTLNGIAAYRLARVLEVPRGAALLSGAMATMLPFITKLHGVLPLIAQFGWLWCLEGLVRFSRTRSWGAAAWAVTGFVANFLVSQQVALLIAPLLAAAGVLALWRPRRTHLFHLGIPALVGATIVIAVALPSLIVHKDQGFSRSDELVQALSARPEDFLTRPDNAFLPPVSTEDTAGLFPGIALSLLAVAGSIAGLRQPRTRTWTWFLIGATVAAALLALGLNLAIGPFKPFGLLRAIVPGLAELRSPFRFAAIVQLSMVALAALALAAPKVRWQRVLVLAVGVLVLGESLNAPPPLVDLRPTPTYASWLATQPADTVVAHVPFPAGVHVSEYEIETWRMLAQTVHGKPIVNGYSGFFPQARTPIGLVVPAYTQFQLAMAEGFPNDRLLCVLSDGLRVNTLVVDNAWADARPGVLQPYAAFLEPAYKDAQVGVYRLRVPTGKCEAR